METSASPAMINTGILSALTSASQAMGSCSRAINFSTTARKPSGLGASFFHSSSMGVPTNISGDIWGMKAVKAGCQPETS
ncbi:hypothetical protein D3C72_2264950 [compost metagenome]